MSDSMPLLLIALAAALSAGQALAGQGGDGGPVRCEPRPAVLHVLGGPAGNRKLSPEAQQYLARLAAFGQRPASSDRRATAGEGVRRLLAEQADRLGPVAFFTRYPLTRPPAPGCAISQSVPERWGCSIRVLDPRQAGATTRTIFADPDGCIYDMNLSLDAATLFFSFRRRTDACWQIYEIGLDGQGLQRISRDPAHHDVGAVELADGRLLFVSTRSGGYLVSEPGSRSNLWVMRRDGRDARCVSQNTLADFSPQVLPDGRVMFTRWEYVDRDLDYRQGLWTQRPDGTGFQLLFGNTIREVGIFCQARPVPGHEDVMVATFAPPTGWPLGAVGLVTHRQGLEAARDRGFTWLTDESFDVGEATIHADGMDYRDIDDGRLRDLALRDLALRDRDSHADLSRAHELEARAGQWLDAGRPVYCDPFPVSDYLFLVSYSPGLPREFDLYLLDLCGNQVRLYSDPELCAHNPLVVRPRTAFAPATACVCESDHDDRAAQWGSALVADVYQGLSGVERGEAKYLQIMEQLPKTQEQARRAYDQSPIMGYGTYYAKRCWGRVTIDADGSAHFQVPALREVYLQVLDAEGRELQRQTSSMQVMPGEVRACIGCHEPRSSAPPASSPLPSAARRAADRPAFPAWTDDGRIDFVTVVQPVLDRYCTRCHSGPDPDGGCDLSGDRTRLFNMAYDNLLGRSRSYRQHNLTTGRMLSQEAARGRPLVHFYWLRRAPTGSPLPGEAGSQVSRIADYLTAAHCGQQVSWEDRQRIYTWIDANVPYYGDYEPTRPGTPGGRDRYADSATGRESAWFAGPFLDVYNRRCISCHEVFPHPNDHERIWDGRFAWINFTHPQWSPALTAHLSKRAGGRGVLVERFAENKVLFADTDDPDYVMMLEAIRAGQE